MKLVERARASVPFRDGFSYDEAMAEIERLRLFGREMADEIERLEIQRDAVIDDAARYRRAEADAAALREALKEIAHSIKWGEDTAIKRSIKVLQETAADALASTTAGADLLAEMERLKETIECCELLKSLDNSAGVLMERAKNKAVDRAETAEAKLKLADKLAEAALGVIDFTKEDWKDDVDRGDAELILEEALVAYLKP